MTVGEFVRETSAWMRDGVLIVRPDEPVFLRSHGWPNVALDDPDARFLAMETRAALVSYCRGLISPVINRPTEVEGASWISVPPVIASLSDAFSFGSTWEMRPELFATSSPKGPGWEIQDLGTFDTCYSPARPHGAGPYRLRRGTERDVFVCVSVVGARSWSREIMPAFSHRLRGASVELARALGLDFAAITWNLSADLRRPPRLAQVSAMPRRDQLVPYECEVIDAILAMLVPRDDDRALAHARQRGTGAASSLAEGGFRGQAAPPRFLPEVKLLSGAECRDIARRLDRAKAVWQPRGSRRGFFTLGVNAYMDLAPSADPESTYFRPLACSNRILSERFGDLLQRLLLAVSETLGKPARYDPDLALPGFHIWIGDAIPTQCSASTHFDLQFESLVKLGRVQPPFEVLSLTVPIRLPTSGGHLRVWDLAYEDVVEGRFGATEQCRSDGGRVVPYVVGHLTSHAGLLYHQIDRATVVRPGDARITLQAHGIISDSDVLIYW